MPTAAPTRARIVGTGGYAPTEVLTNADLAARVETSDEGRIQPGDTILMVSTGAGMSWGAAVVTW